MLTKLSPCYQRYSLILFVLLVCYLSYRHLEPDILPTKDIPLTNVGSCPSSPPKIAYEPAVPRGSFQWRNVLIKHTVQTPMKLSEGEPEPLPRIQHKFGREPRTKRKTRQLRQSAIKTTFLRSWHSYKELAWMKDELSPISGGSKNNYGGWAATLLDSLDTLWIMDLKHEFYAALDFVLEMDFGPSQAPYAAINVFETTIRHLGGLISAYDLAGCKDSRILDKIVQLGDMVLASFATPNHMPVTRWAPRSAANGIEQLPSEKGVLSELGSSALEFTRLSQLTGDMRWYDAAQRITNVLEQQQNATKLPGLWPVGIDVKAPDLTTDTLFSLGAMADSTYEYLPKMYALLHGLGSALQYERMYSSAIEMAVKHLLFRPMVPENDDVLVVGQVRAANPSSVLHEATGQHLVCFVGGMLALGGRLFRNESHVELGAKVTEGCVWAYRNSPLGIMPEWFKMIACKPGEECKWDLARWSRETREPNLRAGFIEIEDKRYLLRPEAIESVFYMYRITGDTKYQDIAWEMFESIEKHTKTDLGNAALRDVTNGEKEDNMESFWMAETLKYFYLIFSEPDLISLDEYVFNTEAHPFRISKPHKGLGKA